VDVVGDALDVSARSQIRGRHRPQIPTGAEESARTRQHDHLRLGDVAARRRVGHSASMASFMPLAASGLFRTMRVTGPVLFEAQVLVVGHAVTLAGARSSRSAVSCRSRVKSPPQPSVRNEPSAITHGLLGRTCAVIAAAVDHRFDQPERQIVGIDRPVALGDDTAGQLPITLPQLFARRRNSSNRSSRTSGRR